MYKLSLLLLVAAVYGSGEDMEDHNFNRTPLGDAIDRTSMKFLKEAYAAAEDKNVVASPLGILMLLSLYSLGAEKSEGIKAEIIKALGSSNYDELYKSYTQLNDRFSSMNGDYLTLANKIYIDDNYELADKFANGAIRSYRGEIEKLEFSDPQLAVATINRWSEEKTKGHIKNPISESDIKPDTVAALVNVIFFQGHWHIPFNASETKEQDFYVDKSNTIKKPMMHLEQPLFYYESPEIGAKIVELPYKEQGFRMVVVLPDEIDGLSSVLEKVEKRGFLKDVFSLELMDNYVILDMPKFEIESGLNLKELLPKVGVSKIFNESVTGIVKEDDVLVDEAIQKAFVKVNEEGATAGVFTGFLLTDRIIAPPPSVFKVDHPFLFAILHEDILVFVGTYTH